MAASFFPALAWATDRTWTGNTNTTWSTAGNWVGNAIPGANDRAIIPNTVRKPVVTASTTIGQLQVAAGSSVTVNNNVVLTVNGTTNAAVSVSPVLDGTGTLLSVGTGLVTVTGGLANGVLINNTMTLGHFTLNAPVGRNLGIPSGNTVTFSGNVNITQSEMHVGAAAGAPSTVVVTGTLTVAAAGTLNMRAPASILQVSGNLTLTGTWTAGTSTLILNPTTDQTLNITTGAPRVFNNVTVQTDAGPQQIDGDLVTPSAGMTINGDLALNRGQFQIGNFIVDVFGNVTTTGTSTTSQLDFTSTGTLRCRGNVTLASLSQIASAVNGPFATIVMNGTTPQTFQILATTASQFHDLDAFQVSNTTAAVTVLNNPNADFTVNGNLVIDPNARLIVQDVFDPESPLTMGANSELRLEDIISPDSTIMGSTFTAGAGSTVTYAGQGVNQIVYAQQNNGTQIQYQNLRIDNNGAVATQQNVANAVSVNGSFTIFDAAASFSGANTRNIIVRQNFVDNGTYTATGNTVTMAGTGSISGTAATLTFNNLLVSGLVTDNVTAQRSFATAGTFQVIQGALTTSGNITMTANAGMSVGDNVGAAGSADLNLVGPAMLALTGGSFVVQPTDGRFTAVAGGGGNAVLNAGGRPATVGGQANLIDFTFTSGDVSGLAFAATATIERLRNVRFTGINAAAGAHHLTISSAGLDLDCPGCMFDTVGAGKFNVWAVDTNPGNGIPVILRFEQRVNTNGPGDIGGPGAGEAFDGDDDTNDDGRIAAPETTTTHGGAIVQWVYTANVDMAGIVQGFPMVAFDWNTFTYYSTYVLMQTSTGGVDRIYVLDSNGDLKPYSFALSNTAERITGPLFWDSEGASHVVYFGTTDGAGVGAVYKLIDTGASLVMAPAPWNTPFTQGSMKEVTSPVVSDRTSIYFAANRGNPNYAVWQVDIATKTQTLSPAIGLNNIRPTTAPSWWIAPTGTYLFWGTPATNSATPTGSRLLRIRTTNWGNVDGEFNRLSAAGPAPPDPAANQDCTTDILALTNVTDTLLNSTVYLYCGEINGYMHAVNALGTFTQTRPGFPFRDKNSAIRGAAVMDWVNGRLIFGNEAGDVYVLGNSTGTWTLGTNYFRLATPGAAAIRTLPLYQQGLIYASNINGSMFVIDANGGAGPAVVRTYNLGITVGTNDISDVSRDFGTNRIYVGTSGGRLYSIPQMTDPTPGSP